MTSRVSRRVMDMNDAELSAVLAVALPRSRFEGISRDHRQEAVIKWLFAHGLGMNHEFMLEIEDDDIYVLMRNKPCACCPKVTAQVVSYRRDGRDGSVQLPGKSQRRSSSGEPPTSASSAKLAPPKQIRRSKSDETITNPETLAERRGQKIQPIVQQPKPMAPAAKKEGKFDKYSNPKIFLFRTGASRQLLAYFLARVRYLLCGTLGKLLTLP